MDPGCRETWFHHPSPFSHLEDELQRLFRAWKERFNQSLNGGGIVTTHQFKDHPNQVSQTGVKIGYTCISCWQSFKWEEGRKAPILVGIIGRSLEKLEGIDSTKFRQQTYMCNTSTSSEIWIAFQNGPKTDNRSLCKYIYMYIICTHGATSGFDVLLLLTTMEEENLGNREMSISGRMGVGGWGGGA